MNAFKNILPTKTLKVTEAIFLKKIAAPCEKYRDFLVESSKKINVISENDLAQIVERHFLDAVAPMELGLVSPIFFETSPTGIDVGTGGGLPGLIWAFAAPQAQLTLLDSVRKKADLLTEAAKFCQAANVRSLSIRAEEAAKTSQFHERLDFAITRAAAPPASAIELCAPFIKVGGSIWLWTGAQTPEQLQTIAHVAAQLGLEAQTAATYLLPLSEAYPRMILHFTKTSPTPAHFPRKVGVAQSKPLT